MIRNMNEKKITRCNSAEPLGDVNETYDKACGETCSELDVLLFLFNFNEFFMQREENVLHHEQPLSILLSKYSLFNLLHSISYKWINIYNVCFLIQPEWCSFTAVFVEIVSTPDAREV